MLTERSASGAAHYHEERTYFQRLAKHAAETPAYLQSQRFTYINDLVPSFVINPDTEKHMARKKQLTPLSRGEAEFAQQELYDRITRVYDKMKNNPKATFARANRVYEMLVKANELVQHNDELLSVLYEHYDLERFQVQSPDVIRQDRAVRRVLAEVFSAEEAASQGWPEITEDEREDRLAEIQNLVAAQDNTNLMVMFERGLNLLETRGYFWTAELGTVVMHEALINLDQVIEEYRGREIEV